MDAARMETGCGLCNRGHGRLRAARAGFRGRTERTSHGQYFVPATFQHTAEGRGKEALAHQPAARPIESPPPPPVIAPVAMTAKQLRTCLVKVGNPLPDGELPLADGKAVPVRSLLGKRGTVVLFWNAQNAYALQALADLQTEVNEPYGGHGIAVIGINVQDSPEDAQVDCRCRESISQSFRSRRTLLRQSGNGAITSALPRGFPG